MHILVVEDDKEAGSFLVNSLLEAGHTAKLAEDGAQAYTICMENDHDCLIVDRMMPNMDGLTFLKKLRDNGDFTPALILSALGQVDDRVEGLRSGGDDYLTKPYAFSELLARVEVLARRRRLEESDTLLQVADLRLDRLTHKVFRGEKKILLQPREFRLLEYLMRNAEKLVTRTMLLEQVWDYHFDPQTNVIDVHISRLRSKIDKEFDQPLLHTIRGAGYILKETPPD